MLHEKARLWPPAFAITNLKKYCDLARLLPVLLFSMFASQVRSQGLLFNSNDSLLLKRTSYQVFHGSVPRFQGQFQVSFDLSIWDKKHLGYVLTLKEDAGKLYTLTYLYPGKDTGYLHFNIGNESNKIKIRLTPDQLRQRQWITIKLDFHLQADSMYMWVNNTVYRAGGFGFPGSMAPSLYFGKFEYLNDVPAMAIRDLQVKGKNIEYHFPLNEWKGETVHTANGKSTGHVDFPNWLINESFFWKERAFLRFNEVAGSCFIPDSAKLIMYGKRSMKVYDIATDRVEERAYRNELPVNMILGKSIYIPSENKVYVYEANDVRKDDPTIAALDLSTLEWQVTGTAYVPEQRHHHNILFDSLTNQFHLFGGYGSFSYFNTFFRYSREADAWMPEQYKGDTITPRFFSASGNAGNPDEVFLFGGFGNPSGQQVVGGRHTYDLYRVNLSNGTIKKLWERKISDSNFVPANNLVLSPDRQHFYVICYPHHISRTGFQLYRFSIEDGSYEIVSSKVPVTSEKIESDINLYLNKSTGELFCVVQEFEDAKNSTFRILSLAWPPVPPLPEHSGTAWVWVWLLSLATVAGGLWLIVRNRKRKSAGMQVQPRQETSAETAANPENTDGNAAPASPAIRRNAIFILGPMAVYDKKGTEITHLFSPKIRQLFVLILLKTRQNGITSREISIALWPDKEVTKTKNIRGVNINHLRNAITDLEGIRLVFTNDSYIFEIDEGLFCDYLELIKEIRQPSGMDITPIFTRGNLLADNDDPSLDPLRQAYEDEAIPFVLERLKGLYQQQDLKTVIRLTDAILDIDPFNEQAIQFQLAAIRRSKGSDAARKKYDAFVLNYEKSLGIPYTTSFEKMPVPDSGPSQ